VSAPIPRVEAGTTKEFIATYSAAPGSTPLLAIWAGSGQGTIVGTATGVASTSTTFAATFTVSTPDLYAWTWTASFTAGPVVARGLFHCIRTIPG
jgi:hypothetical protein